MDRRPLPDAPFLWSLFDYEPASGLLRWRVDIGRAKKGAVAGSVRKNGYRLVAVGRQTYMAHRIIWKMLRGVEPGGVIDHIDGDPGNNRAENLREATHSENSRNQKIQRRNKSGVTGVSWCSHGKRWTARLRVDGRYLFLGYHDTIEAAAEARRAAEARLLPGTQRGQIVPSPPAPPAPSVPAHAAPRVAAKKTGGVLAKPLPSATLLQQLFTYDSVAGELRHRVDKGGRAKAGDLAGSVRDRGHLKTCIFGLGFYVHRIAWKMHYGEEPPPFVDHINGDPADNRIANLRAVTWQQNQWNRRHRKGALSGLKGVSWSGGKWQVCILHGGRQVVLGRYDDKHEAHAVYQEASRRLRGGYDRTAVA